MFPGAHNREDDPGPMDLTLVLILAGWSWVIIFALLRFFYLLIR